MLLNIEMIYKTSIFLVLCLSVQIINGCFLDNAPTGVPINIDVWDTARGIIYNRPATNFDFTGVSVVSNSGKLQYIDAHISDSIFSVYTTDNFALYEEYETIRAFTVVFSITCSGGGVNQQLVVVTVHDTNNNSPIFQPAVENNEHRGYEFKIVPPLAAGFQITSNENAIVVRDIDLTTHRIIFTITGSNAFEIIYDEALSTERKLFVATLKTTAAIQSLPQPLELVISATDLDRTTGPQRTTYTTVRLVAEDDRCIHDRSMHLWTTMDEPEFAEPLYMSIYRDNAVFLEQPISLIRGYSEDVVFSLRGEFSVYFAIIMTENDISLFVITPLPEVLFIHHHIFLILRAEKINTRGASTVIAVQLPSDNNCRTIPFEKVEKHQDDQMLAVDAAPEY